MPFKDPEARRAHQRRYYKSEKQREKRRRYQKRYMRRRRFRIFERDGFTCTYCGRDLRSQPKLLHLDHKIPYSAGRPRLDVDDNLVTACGPCNRRKGTMPYEQFKALMDSELAQALDEWETTVNEDQHAATADG